MPFTTPEATPANLQSSSEELTTPDILREAACLHEIKNAEYGDNFRNYAAVMQALFPTGIHLENYEDHIRFQMLSLKVVKLTRYATNWHKGHNDSLDDDIVYTAMLKQVDSGVFGPSLPSEEHRAKMLLAAIEYSLQHPDDGIEWLRAWNEGSPVEMEELNQKAKQVDSGVFPSGKKDPL